MQHLRYTKHNRAVSVVSTLVRNTLVLRLIRKIQRLVDPHGIHISAKQYGLSTAPEAEFRQQVVSFRESENFGRLKAFQFVSDEGGSLYFLIGGLGHAM